MRSEFEPKRVTQSNQNRVVKILTHLGFHLERARTPDRPGGRQKRYRRDPVSRKKP